jgi:4-hydroxy-3-methylbut-2-enyl diphosphate reductase
MHNECTYHLQNLSELDPELVKGKKIAGVTAGASTPDWVIDEFVEGLEKI